MRTIFIHVREILSLLLFEKIEYAHHKILIKPLKEANVGVAWALFDT